MISIVKLAGLNSQEQISLYVRSEREVWHWRVIILDGNLFVTLALATAHRTQRATRYAYDDDRAQHFFGIRTGSHTHTLQRNHLPRRQTNQDRTCLDYLYLELGLDKNKTTEYGGRVQLALFYFTWEVLLGVLGNFRENNAAILITIRDESLKY